MEVEKSGGVEDMFQQMKLSYTVSNVRVEDEECRLYLALIPDQLIDEVIDKISKRLDLRRKENMINVVDVEGFVSSYLERLEEKAAEVESPSNPLERLVESTGQYTRLSVSMATMAMFATLIALAGLFLDKVVIVIGAMLLSPLLGPINAFAVNASLGRIKKVIENAWRSEYCTNYLGDLFFTFMNLFASSACLPCQIKKFVTNRKHCCKFYLPIDGYRHQCCTFHLKSIYSFLRVRSDFVCCLPKNRI